MVHVICPHTHYPFEGEKYLVVSGRTTIQDMPRVGSHDAAEQEYPMYSPYESAALIGLEGMAYEGER